MSLLALCPTVLCTLYEDKESFFCTFLYLYFAGPWTSVPMSRLAVTKMLNAQTLSAVMNVVVRKDFTETGSLALEASVGC